MLDEKLLNYFGNCVVKYESKKCKKFYAGGLLFSAGLAASFMKQHSRHGKAFRHF